MKNDKWGKKVKILIIGNKGMLGQALEALFRLDENYEVIGWDREEIDITKLIDQKEKIISLKPDIIINAAAYNAVDKCEESEEEYQKANLLNGQAPGDLAKIAQEIDAIFVHYSSDYVFSGHENKKEFTEADRPNPISNYGRSKFLGEQEVQNKGEKYYIIRLSKLFGRPAKSENAKRSFFEIMLELGPKMARENKELSVVDEELSCFTYAPDLALATKRIIEQNQTFGIYHITNFEPATWYQATRELFKLAGQDVKLKAVGTDAFPRPAPRPKFSVLKNTKTKVLRSYLKALKEYIHG